jgi:hypothetical protein
MAPWPCSMTAAPVPFYSGMDFCNSIAAPWTFAPVPWKFRSLLDLNLSYVEPMWSMCCNS